MIGTGIVVSHCCGTLIFSVSILNTDCQSSPILTLTNIQFPTVMKSLRRGNSEKKEYDKLFSRLFRRFIIKFGPMIKFLWLDFSHIMMYLNEQQSSTVLVFLLGACPMSASHAQKTHF